MGGIRSRLFDGCRHLVTGVLDVFGSFLNRFFYFLDLVFPVGLKVFSCLFEFP
jgi:hypothetical protein